MTKNFRYSDSLVKRIGTGLFLLALTALPAAAQTSVYSSMALAGTFNNFSAGANNMTLVSNNTWQGDFYFIAAAENKLKFAANGSYFVNWGQNVSFSNLPYIGTGVVNTANDFIFRNVEDSHYRLTFNDATRVYRVERLGYSIPYTNRVRNAGFELAVSTNEYADPLYWTGGFPDYRAGKWGSSLRNNWRSFNGSYQAAIGTTPNFGGFYQDMTAGPEFDYEASGYFWADTVVDDFGPWTAAVQEIKVEFFGPTFGVALGSISTNLNDVTSSYTKFTVRGPAPNGATWARLVVNVNGAGEKGSLQFDDMSLAEYPRFSQAFDTWTFATNTGNHARGGWRIVNGLTTTDTNLIYATRTAQLKTGGEIQTPNITGGIGRLTFYYRNNSQEVEDIQPITFDVEKSINGSSWDFVERNSNAVEQFYVQRSVNINDPNARYVRIRQAAGTNSLLVDNIGFSAVVDNSRFQDFNSWTNSSFTTNSCISFDTWALCTGRITTVDSYDGKTAVIAAGLITNYLRSPFYADGYGTISFYYSRGTNGNGPAQISLQSSPDGITWTTLAAISNINSTSYAYYEKFFFQPAGRYVRIANIPIIIVGGSTLILDEEFNGGNVTPPADWALTSMGQYTSPDSSGRNPPSLQFNSTGDRVVTPTMSNPTNLSFLTKGNSVDALSALLVEGLIGTNWITITNVVNLTNLKVTRSMKVTNTITQFRFTYTKIAGNIGFDDVIIHGIPDAGPPSPQDLRIDNVNIQSAQEYRIQNFDAWPSKSGYTTGTSEFQGWSVADTIIDEQRSYVGQVGRLNTTASGPFIQSHFYPDGIGNISFYYRSWATAVTLSLQTSTNGSTWTTLTNIAISAAASTNDPFFFFSEYYNNTNGAYVRLTKGGGSERILLDQIEITRPSPPATISISTFLTPSVPFTNDAVRISALIFPLNGASDIAATSYYRIGTSGVFTALPMILTNFGEYATVGTIPAQKAGTTVQYFVRATFNGPGSKLSSPQSYPVGSPTNLLTYSIPRSAPGRVWINEARYDEFDCADEYIELAGAAGINLAGWRIRFLGYGQSNGLPVVMASYLIPQPTILSNESNGYGFWVIGDATNIASRDMTLTNQLYSLRPLGVQLINEVGGIEQYLSFNGYMPFANNVPAIDDGWGTCGLTAISLVGVNTSYVGFVWDDYIEQTPGSVNAGQLFSPPSAQYMNSPDIYSITIATDIVYIISVNNTSNWAVAPFYNLSLPDTPQNWYPITPFNSSASGSTNTMWFVLPPTNNVIFRVRYSL